MINETITSYNASMSAGAGMSNTFIPIIVVVFIASFVFALACSFVVYAWFRKLMKILSASGRYAFIGGTTAGVILLVYYSLTQVGDLIVNNLEWLGYAVVGYIALCIVGFIIDKFVLVGIMKNDQKYNKANK